MESVKKPKAKRKKTESSHKHHNISKTDKDFGLTDEILNVYNNGTFQFQLILRNRICMELPPT